EGKAIDYPRELKVGEEWNYGNGEPKAQSHPFNAI
ncbi:unnamed protein product, partial [marine sediment metagenome]